MKPIVAIVGRPNVGKSTLFNRITRKKDALVDNFPGVTRDCHFGDATWNDIDFTLVDTGGFMVDAQDPFSEPIRVQVNQAVEDADAVILVLDGKEGVSPFDTDMLKLLRDYQKPVFYAVNKIDGMEKEVHLYDFYSLGIEKLYPVSGEHGYGVPDFLDDMVRELPVFEAETSPDVIRVAVVGRPNVGKSSLINKIIGENRLLVSETPGTTRDAIDLPFEVNGKSYLLIDTAGIRRKSKVSEKIEKFSIIKSLRSLDRCDVALMVIDAHAGITEQDITVAGHAYERGCGCIFLLNKWDIVEKEDKNVKKYYEKLRMDAKFLSYAPAMTISALTGLRVQRIFTLVDEVYTQYATRISTGQVNKIIDQATTKTEPSLHKGKRIKFYYSTQISSKPPTFVCFVNYPDAVHFSYRRYLSNHIREACRLDKTPIRLFFRLRTGRIDFAKRNPKRKNDDRKTKRIQARKK